MKRSELKRKPESIRAFQERGRKSSAEALGMANISGRRSRPKKSAISPASPAQRSAVNGKVCLGCGREGSEWLAIDPAHVWPRGRGGCNSRFCVAPLCRDFVGRGCHRDFDEGKLDLLSILVADWEKWRFHFVHALQHTTPVQLIERLAGSRVQWVPTSLIELARGEG